MPQATEKQRRLMTKWFGDFDIHGPSNFLLSRGYTIDGGWIRKPVPSHTVSIEEGQCIDFLQDEWDYGY